MNLSGHAYPWDVLGDPDFPYRVRDLGLSSVTLAAAYHSTRAATPLHPGRQLVDAYHAALYRPMTSAWAGRRLRPASPQWMSELDPFGAAAAALRRAGIEVTAWVVLTHSTRLGSAFPDVAVENCFGERYSYALCPAHEEVREYAATLAAEAVREVPLAGVSLEACGQLGLTHLGQHEKTDGAWTEAAARWLSVCCCAACRVGWVERGLDPEEVRSRLRAAVRERPEGRLRDVARPEGVLQGIAGELLAVRQEATDALRVRVLTGLGGHPVTLHAQADPWATGPSPGLTPTAAGDVAALLVPAWPTTPASVDGVAAAVAAAAPPHDADPGTVPAGRSVSAYVTVLPPADPDQVPDHIRRLVAAGATGFGLYHLGLAPRWRQPALAKIVEVAGA